MNPVVRGRAGFLNIPVGVFPGLLKTLGNLWCTEGLIKMNDKQDTGVLNCAGQFRDHG
jgi:hypothetical protein